MTNCLFHSTMLCLGASDRQTDRQTELIPALKNAAFLKYSHTHSSTHTQITRLR